MRINEFVPLVHLGQLRRKATEANCPGLVRAINKMAEDFLRHGSPPKGVPVKPPNDTGEETDQTSVAKAYGELLRLINRRYGRFNRRADVAAERSGDDHDCSGLLRQLVQIAETVPTMRAEPRAVLDQFFAECLGVPG